MSSWSLLSFGMGSEGLIADWIVVFFVQRKFCGFVEELNLHCRPFSHNILFYIFSKQIVIHEYSSLLYPNQGIGPVMLINHDTCYRYVFFN